MHELREENKLLPQLKAANETLEQELKRSLSDNDDLRALMRRLRADVRILAGANRVLQRERDAD